MAPSGREARGARKATLPSREDAEPAGTQDSRWPPGGLDPRTLRLLWGQRELEIQALRRSLRSQRDARGSYILQEVVGCPAHRSRLSRESLLQKQIQKLTMDLEEQKEQAQLEKEHLQAELLHSCRTLQQVEAELQAFRRSCLLQLAHSSWVGRVLRSSTGSVEVVTAENLLDLSDSSEDERVPTAGEGFRMEDVDWNSIAQRFPNLLSQAEARAAEKYWRHQHPECLKSVEWSPPPSSPGSGSSGQAEGSGQRAAPQHREPQDARAAGPGGPARADAEGQRPHLPKSPAEQQSVQRRTGVDPAEAAGEGGQSPPLLSSPSPPRSSLKIMTVSRRERCIRVLNESAEHTVDLAGHVLVQQVGDFPVCMFRFPSNLQLEPHHHVTVWGEGAQQQRAWSPRRERVQFYSSRRCATLLLNPKGEVLSSFRAPHCVSEVSRLFEDDTDLSIDRFPLSEAKTGLGRRQSRAPRKGRGQRPRPRWEPGTPAPRGAPDPREACPESSRPPPRPGSPPDPRPGAPRPARAPASGTPEHLPRLSSSKPVDPRDGPALPEGAHTPMPQEPPVTSELGLGVDGRRDRKERGVQVGRKRVDRSCPMVALSVQNTAESKFGFRFLSYPPITTVPLAGVAHHTPCQRWV